MLRGLDESGSEQATSQRKPLARLIVDLLADQPPTRTSKDRFNHERANFIIGDAEKESTLAAVKDVSCDAIQKH